MEAPRSKREILRAFGAAPPEVRRFLADLPHLVESEALEHGLFAALAYGFHRLEVAHRAALYRGLVRVHGVEPTLARHASQGEHLSREHFHALMREILRRPLPAGARTHYDIAVAIRDDVLHGKDVPAASLRKALLALVRYAVGLQRFCAADDAALSPFSGGHEVTPPTATHRLDRDTSRFVLRGMGFTALS